MTPPTTRRTTSRTARAALRIARREFVERGRSRAFIISNLVVLAALVAGIAIPAFAGGDGARRLGYLPAAEQAARLVQQQAAQSGTEVSLVRLDDRASAAAAVLSPDERPVQVPEVTEALHAVLLDADSVLVHEQLPRDLEPVLSSAARAVQVQSVLADSDVRPEQVEALLAPAQIDVEALDPPQEADEGPGLAIGAVAVFTLYGLLLFYGQFVSSGIVEEKSSRVVELLLSTVPPTAVLYGKILGLAALGIVQTLLLGVVGLGASIVLLDVTIPTEAVATVVLAIAWFVLGFLLYATLFAVAASLVSRQEDLQATIYPPMIAIVGSFFIAQYTLQDPDSTISLVGGLVPFTAPLVQPLRYGAGVIHAWEVPVAVALCVLTIALLVPLAARFYAGSALRFGGRVSLREAWRGTR